MKSNILQEDKKKIGFYIIHNSETDETYVGSGILGNRESYHRNALENGKIKKRASDGKLIQHHNYKLQNAYNKNSNFDFIGISIEETNFTAKENRSLALNIEQSIIDDFKDNSLFLNLANDAVAPRVGMFDTEETKIKKSIALKERWQDEKYRNLMIVANTGRERKLETTEKIIAKTTGLKRTLECRNQFSERQTKIMQNPINRQNISAALLGYKHSDETKEKISNIHKELANTDHGKQKLQRILLLANIARSKLISIDNTVYNSISEAAKSLNIPTSTIFNRINAISNKFNSWNYVTSDTLINEKK